MNSGLLSIYPPELQFPFELNKRITCTMQITNNTNNVVAFKVLTTTRKQYCVRPCAEIVLPHCICHVLVTMQKQTEPPADMQCKDKFLVQSMIISPKSASGAISSDMFGKESRNKIDEYKLKVRYVLPAQPLSATVHQVSDERRALKPTRSYNASSTPVETLMNLNQAISMMSKMAKDRDQAMQLNFKLSAEVESLKVMVRRGPSDNPYRYIYIVVVVLMGVAFGYCLSQFSSSDTNWLWHDIDILDKHRFAENLGKRS